MVIAPAGDPSGKYDDELKAVRYLVAIFAPERWLNFGAATAAIGIFLYGAMRLIDKGQADATVLTSLFGSTGGFAIVAGRILLMFNKAMDVVFPRQNQ